MISLRAHGVLVEQDFQLSWEIMMDLNSKQKLHGLLDDRKTVHVYEVSNKKLVN